MILKDGPFGVVVIAVYGLALTGRWHGEVGSRRDDDRPRCGGPPGLAPCSSSSWVVSRIPCRPKHDRRRVVDGSFSFSPGEFVRGCAEDDRVCLGAASGDVAFLGKHC